MCNLASIALPRFVRETEPHGRESKKLVGSLDAANRQGRAGRHPWQVVFCTCCCTGGSGPFTSCALVPSSLMLQLHCAAASLQAPVFCP